ASAAYWIASSADEIVVTPSGEVGSIGVFTAHEDISAALEAEGVTVTLISAGKYKTEGNPFEPLSEEARGAIQARVDDYYSMFVRAVARGRGVKPADVRGGFGQGRVVGADEAVRLGMADRVGTMAQTVERLAGRRGGAGSRAEDERRRFELHA
ncbi:MAG: S49 family peptidase, partial [Chloroflexi bacterium]|nr:S49 family peptidase [Chloroflexota bacterium]